MKLGFSKMQADDYLMVNATFWYTLLAVSINKMIAGGGSNYMTAEEEASLTPQTIKDRIEGSKWVFVSEQAMICTIWSLKLCMLFIYSRLTYVTLSRMFSEYLYWPFGKSPSLALLRITGGSSGSSNIADICCRTGTG